MRRVATLSEIVAVVTQPDRPAGRGHKLTPSPIKVAALELGAPIFMPLRLKPFALDLQKLSPDILVVASFGRILPQAILDVPRSGLAFNVHPSRLPLYRGATPLQSALRDGRTQTGVSIIAMDAGMDTGDILVAEQIAIGAGETYGELHDRLALRGAELLGTAIERLTSGALERTPQDRLGIEPGEIAATLTRPLDKADLEVDWTWPAARIVNAVRALAPQPAARAVIGGERVKLLAARAARRDEVGMTDDGGFVEQAGDGDGVVVLRVTPPNRAAMTGAAYRSMQAAV